MKKGKLSRAVMCVKGSPKKHDTAFRIRLGKDEAGTQFLEIRFRERRAIIAATDLLLTRRELAAKLIAQGVPVFDHRKLTRLESAAQRAIEAPEPAFTLVSRPGWIGGSAFAHGLKLVGSLPRGYVFHAHGLDLGDRPAKFGVRGSLKAWKKFVVRVAKDQPLVIFLLCVAFASMILHLLKVQPFVILLHGHSSIGKSMLAKFVGSVAGGDPTSPETGFAESFKATDVGLEKIFLAHNNLILILNEFSRVQGSADTKVDVLEATVNDLCAGIPKTRGTDRKGALRYSTCGIVTSNKSYTELLAEAQREPAEAMGPRLIELCAELDPKLGIFGQMPQGFDSSTQAIKAMREAADQNYGWPARSFARRISEHTARRSDTVTRIIAKWERFFSKRLGADLTGVEGQVRDKLAGVGAAGILAKRLGVIPKEIKIIPAIDWAWKAITKEQPLSARRDPIGAVRGYIEENRSRFLQTPLSSKYDEADVMGFLGLIHDGEHGLEYLVPKPAFDAAFASLGGSKVVMPQLVREGLAVVENLDGRKFQVKRQIGRKLRVRLYLIKAKILDRA